VRTFGKPPKLILDWGQRDSWDEATGPNFKGDIFYKSFFISTEWKLCSPALLFTLCHLTALQQYHAAQKQNCFNNYHTNNTILHSVRKFRVSVMNLWDSSCFKWEGAEVREAPTVLRAVNLQTQIRTREPIHLVTNFTESRLFFIGLYGHTI
jgi:hypothetical protein